MSFNDCDGVVASESFGSVRNQTGYELICIGRSPGRVQFQQNVTCMDMCAVHDIEGTYDFARYRVSDIEPSPEGV